MKALIFDTETTDLDAPEVVEVAYAELEIAGMQLEGERWTGRFKPSKPISLGAMATHHITNDDVANCPPSSLFRLNDSVHYLIGHNVDFDWRAIGEPDVKRIDTCAMARALWPEADSHTLGAMMYLHYPRDARPLLREAHSALADVLNCHRLLQKIDQKAGPFVSFEELWQASERMRVPTTMPFGKHKGWKIADIPRDYKRWLLGQPDVDPYLAKALRAA